MSKRRAHDQDDNEPGPTRQQWIEASNYSRRMVLAHQSNNNKICTAVPPEKDIDSRTNNKMCNKIIPGAVLSKGDIESPANEQNAYVEIETKTVSDLGCPGVNGVTQSMYYKERKKAEKRELDSLIRQGGATMCPTKTTQPAAPEPNKHKSTCAWCHRTDYDRLNKCKTCPQAFCEECIPQKVHCCGWYKNQARAAFGDGVKLDCDADEVAGITWRRDREQRLSLT